MSVSMVVMTMIGMRVIAVPLIIMGPAMAMVVMSVVGMAMVVMRSMAMILGRMIIPMAGMLVMPICTMSVCAVVVAVSGMLVMAAAMPLRVRNMVIMVRAGRRKIVMERGFFLRSRHAQH